MHFKVHIAASLWCTNILRYDPVHDDRTLVEYMKPTWVGCPTTAKTEEIKPTAK